MSGAHWSEQSFIDHLYGLETDTSHLDVCPACRARSNEMAAIRRGILREPGVSAGFLAAQRRAIHARLGVPPKRRARAVPAFAAAAMVVVALLVIRPDGHPSPALVTSSADSQLLSEIYELEQSSEPQAARTIQALFEEN